MSRQVRWLVTAWLLILAMIVIAMWWVHNSHTRDCPDGPVLMHLWGSHGLHVLDMVILACMLQLAYVLHGVPRNGLHGTVTVQSTTSAPEQPFPEDQSPHTKDSDSVVGL